MAHLVEVTGVDLVETGLGETNAGRSKDGARSRAISGRRSRSQSTRYSSGPNAWTRTTSGNCREQIANPHAAGLNIDNIPPAENPLRQIGHAAG